MGGAGVEAEEAVEGKDAEGEDAVEGDDTGEWEPRAAASAAMTTSRPATWIARIRVRRIVLRAGSL
jgi:hypothetical protein